MSSVVSSPTRTYGHGFLLALYSSSTPAEPRSEVVDRLREVGLWTQRLCLCRTRTRGAWLRPRRGSRAGRRQCAKRPILQTRENGTFVPVSVSLLRQTRSARSACNSSAIRSRQLVDVQLRRCHACSAASTYALSAGKSTTSWSCSAIVRSMCSVWLRRGMTRSLSPSVAYVRRVT